MRFSTKHIRWGETKLVAKKNGFVFSIIQWKDKYWYCAVSHQTKDIRFNSLWQGINFSSLENAKIWCDQFDANNFGCLGSDFK